MGREELGQTAHPVRVGDHQRAGGLELGLGPQRGRLHSPLELAQRGRERQRVSRVLRARLVSLELARAADGELEQSSGNRTEDQKQQRPEGVATVAVPTAARKATASSSSTRSRK